MGLVSCPACYIALGGNLGDVQACFVNARKQLEALPGSNITASSLLYDSRPLGPADQPDYLNAMVVLETRLSPLNLLDQMRKIEADHGRQRTQRWGARTLDLDLIACENMVLDSPNITLPHPHLHERMFVLQPLCDIVPDWQHPGLKITARELMEALIIQGEKPLAEGKPW